MPAPATLVRGLRRPTTPASKPAPARRPAPRWTRVLGAATAALVAALGAFVVLASIVLASVVLASTARAATPDLTLICRNGSGEHRLLEPRTGATYPIGDPGLAAVADKACAATPRGSTSGRVEIVNHRQTPIFVGFTGNDHKPGPITWGAGCTRSATGARIEPGATCAAKVAANAVSTRFCAALNAVPADCFDAQTNHQTMIETIFEPAENAGCFKKGNCVWFDISVIPSTCTDTLWKTNRCANTGGASYNLPVSLLCNGHKVYTCRGPRDSTHGPALYPSNCGNPTSTCESGPHCQNAYFYPMFVPPENKYQPNSVCLGGQVLTILFLPGP